MKVLFMFISWQQIPPFSAASCAAKSTIQISENPADLKERWLILWKSKADCIRKHFKNLPFTIFLLGPYCILQAPWSLSLPVNQWPKTELSLSIKYQEINDFPMSHNKADTKLTESLLFLTVVECLLEMLSPFVERPTIVQVFLFPYSNGCSLMISKKPHPSCQSQTELDWPSTFDCPD